MFILQYEKRKSNMSAVYDLIHRGCICFCSMLLNIKNAKTKSLLAEGYLYNVTKLNVIGGLNDLAVNGYVIVITSIVRNRSSFNYSGYL